MPGPTLSFGYELIHLFVHSTGTFHTCYWFCFVGNQLCSPTSWLEHHWATLLPEVIASSSGKIGLEDTHHSGWEYDSAPCLGVGKLGSRANKTPLKIRIRQICSPPSSQLGSADEQSCWLGLLLGHCSMSLVCQDLCAGCCEPLPLFSVTVRFPVVEPHRFPIFVVQDQSRGFHKMTQNTGSG